METAAQTPETPAMPLKGTPADLSIKLDDSNFLLWWQQVLATIRGYNLHKFMDGSEHIPAKFATPEDEKFGKISK